MKFRLDSVIATFGFKWLVGSGRIQMACRLRPSGMLALVPDQALCLVATRACRLLRLVTKCHPDCYEKVLRPGQKSFRWRTMQIKGIGTNWPLITSNDCGGGGHTVLCVEVRLGCDPVESVDSDPGLVVEGALSVRLTDYSVHVEGIIWQRNAGRNPKPKFRVWLIESWFIFLCLDDQSLQNQVIILFYNTSPPREDSTRER